LLSGIDPPFENEISSGRPNPTLRHEINHAQAKFAQTFGHGSVCSRSLTLFKSPMNCMRGIFLDVVRRGVLSRTAPEICDTQNVDHNRPVAGFGNHLGFMIG
jgi:hypothetical protein